MMAVKATAPGTVFVIDDDAPLRRSLERLFSSVGLRVESFATADEFLASADADGPGCLVLDVRLPGLSGLDLQAELAKKHGGMPIVFITGYGDIPMSVRAMKAGAIEFLAKPLRDQDLLDAVKQGLDRARALGAERKAVAEIEVRLGSLTAREQQVLPLIVSGLKNKQIAARIGISEITAKVHRSNTMRKMTAGSISELIAMMRLLESSRGK